MTAGLTSDCTPRTEAEHSGPLSESESHLVVSDSLGPHGLYSPWNSPGQNTGVACLFSRGIFPTQELNRVSCIAGRFFTNRAIREGRPTYVMPKFVTQKLGGWQVILCCRAIKLEGICFTAISSYRRCSSFGMQDSFCSFLSEITKIRNKSF